MTPFTLMVAGGIGCVAFVLLGLCFVIAGDPARPREPLGARVCFLFAALGMILMFGATVAEIAIRIFAP